MTTYVETYTDRTPVNHFNRYRVYYRLIFGHSKTYFVQALDVEVPETKEQPYKLAELLALKYLLLTSSAIGENRSGNNMVIHVSSGAIKKVQKRHTSSPALIHHGQFLQIRFSDAEITTARKFGWISEFNREITQISSSDCIDKLIKTDVGELHLTRHAVERFMERKNIASLDRAWRRLSKLLTVCDWKNVKPTQPINNSKSSQTSETWLLEKKGSPLINIVIVRTGYHNSIVTVTV